MATKTKPKPKAKPRAKPRAKPKPRTPPRARLNAPEMVKVLLTVEEAAHKLSVGRTSVYKLMKRDELRYVLVGSTRRIPVEAISDYVARQLGQRQAIAS